MANRFNYPRTAARAVASLKRYGAGVLVHFSSLTGEYVPGETLEDEIVTLDGTGVVLDVEQDDIDGTMVQIGDSYMLLATVTGSGAPMPKPTTADTVTAIGRTWNITKAEEINPAGVPVLLIVYLRGGAAA